MVLPEYKHKQRADNRTLNRTCDGCGKSKKRNDLRSKRVQFAEPGAGGRVIRTRTVAWLCLECMKQDSDYNRVKHLDSPAFRKTELPDIPVPVPQEGMLPIGPATLEPTRHKYIEGPYEARCGICDRPLDDHNADQEVQEDD